MKSILPIFAALAVALAAAAAKAQLPRADALGAPAKAPSPAPRPSDSISGDALLRRVLTAVDAQPSVSAKVRYLVDLGGRAAIGSGIYLQQGRGPARMLRLELNLQLDGTDNAVRQICDGSTLWIVDELAGDRTVALVDVARLRQARPKPDSAAAPDGWLALGGVPKLLSSLDASFRFGAVSESKLDELQVWTMRGQWEPWRLVHLLPEQKGAIEAGSAADTSKLPAHLPDTVVMHVGCDDFFPYRIEYWRGPPSGGTTTEAGRPLVVMELYEVHLGGPIDAAQFAFQPGDVKPIDRTAEFLERLGLEDTTAGARRRSLLRR